MPGSAPSFKRCPPEHNPELCGLDGGPANYPMLCPGCLWERDLAARAAEQVRNAPPVDPRRLEAERLAALLRDQAETLRPALLDVLSQAIGELMAGAE
jgi:hypothetical protein